MKELCRDFREASGEDLETEADVFVSTLMLGPIAFSKNVFDTGLDPIFLGRIYNFNYGKTLRLMINALTQTRGPQRFWATMLDPRRLGCSGYLYTTGSMRSPRFQKRSRGQSPNSFFPRRGQQVKPSPNLKRAIRYGKSVYIDRAYGMDFGREFDLSVIIRPYFRRGEVHRVIVLAVPYKDNGKLTQQILRVRPIRMEESFQLP